MKVTFERIPPPKPPVTSVILTLTVTEARILRSFLGRIGSDDVGKVLGLASDHSTVMALRNVTDEMWGHLAPASTDS